MNRERAGLSPRPGLDGGRRSWTRGRRLQRVGVLLVLAFGASCSSSDGGHDSARPSVTVLAPNGASIAFVAHRCVPPLELLLPILPGRLTLEPRVN